MNLVSDGLQICNEGFGSMPIEDMRSKRLFLYKKGKKSFHHVESRERKKATKRNSLHVLSESFSAKQKKERQHAIVCK